MRGTGNRRRLFVCRTAKSSPVSCRRRQRGLFANGRWLVAPNWKKIGVERVRISHWSELQVQMPNDFPMVDVLRLRPLEGHRLWVRFTDGSEGVRDLSDVIAQGGPMVEPLKAQDYFNRVFVEMGAPTWPNGFDIDPINLYMELRDAGALSAAAAE